MSSSNLQEYGFKPFIDNTIQPQPTYVNPAQMYSTLPFIPQQSHSFNEFMPNMINSKAINPANIRFSTIPDPMAVMQNPVGLSFNTVANTTDTPIQEPTDAHINFGNLVQPATVVDQKFVAQAIPVDMDRSMLPKPGVVETVIADANAHFNKQTLGTDLISNRKLNNWFTRLLDQRGQDYIASGKLTVDEVSRNSERILDDMIAGRIDYTKQGQYIIEPVVIETLISYCNNKLAINTALQFALGYFYNDYTNRNYLTDDPERFAVVSNIDDAMSRNIAQSISIVNQDIGVYTILYNKLVFVNNTKNASVLFNLANEMNVWRKQVKKRY